MDKLRKIDNMACIVDEVLSSNDRIRHWWDFTLPCSVIQTLQRCGKKPSRWKDGRRANRPNSRSEGDTEGEPLKLDTIAYGEDRPDILDASHL